MTEERWADSEAEATQTVEDGMAALNSGDDEALFDTFHMPHVRISGTGGSLEIVPPERKRQVPAPSSNPTTQPLRQSIPPNPESLPQHRRPRRRPRHRRLPTGRGVTVPVGGMCGVGGQATRRRSESVRGS